MTILDPEMTWRNETTGVTNYLRQLICQHKKESQIKSNKKFTKVNFVIMHSCSKLVKCHVVSIQDFGVLPNM